MPIEKFQLFLETWPAHAVVFYYDIIKRTLQEIHPGTTCITDTCSIEDEHLFTVVTIPVIPVNFNIHKFALLARENARKIELIIPYVLDHIIGVYYYNIDTDFEFSAICYIPQISIMCKNMFVLYIFFEDNTITTSHHIPNTIMEAIMSVTGVPNNSTFGPHIAKTPNVVLDVCKEIIQITKQKIRKIGIPYNNQGRHTIRW